MSEPAREEVETAFQRFWTVGNVNEDWAAWTQHFTEDVRYIEHIYGEMRGRAAGTALGRQAASGVMPTIFRVRHRFAAHEANELVARLLRVHVLEETLARAEEHGGDVDLELLDEPRLHVLLNGVRAAGDVNVF